MIIECPECGAKNQTTQPPQPGKAYRCGKCGASITFLETVDTQDTLIEIPKEKAQAEKQAEVKKEQAEKTKKKVGIGCAVIAVLIVIGILIGSLAPGDKTIDYQVLREWDIPAGGIGMELLVSEITIKEEVLTLATYLRSKYSHKGYIFITIYDSKEAQISSLQGNLSDEEFLKHVLATIFRNPKTGYDEIEWLATERGY